LLPKHQTVEGDVVVGDEATGIGRRPCHPGGKLGDQNLKLIKVDLEAPGPANSGRFQRSLWMPEPTNFFGGTKDLRLRRCAQASIPHPVGRGHVAQRGSPMEGVPRSARWIKGMGWRGTIWSENPSSWRFPNLVASHVVVEICQGHQDLHSLRDQRFRLICGSELHLDGSTDFLSMMEARAVGHADICW